MSFVEFIKKSRRNINQSVLSKKKTSDRVPDIGAKNSEVVERQLSEKFPHI